MGILSTAYAGSFDSTQFMELSSSNFHPGMDIVTDGTLYNRTGGSHTYVDMGRAPSIFTIEVGVEGTQRAALEGKRGVSGSLVWSRGTQTATLLDILPSDVDVVDANKVSLRFFSNDLPSGVVSTTAIITEGGATIITESGDTIITE